MFILVMMLVIEKKVVQAQEGWNTDSEPTPQRHGEPDAAHMRVELSCVNLPVCQTFWFLKRRTGVPEQSRGTMTWKHH